jgi:hypothetical protein
MPGASLSNRRYRLSTSSKDSLSNIHPTSSGRSQRRSRHHPSSSSSSSSTSRSSSSGIERLPKHSTKLSSKSSTKPKNSRTSNASNTDQNNNNNNSKVVSKKSSSSTKDPSSTSKNSTRTRTLKSDKNLVETPAILIPSISDTPIVNSQQQQQPVLPNAVVLPTLTADEPIHMDCSPPSTQIVSMNKSSLSPKAPSKNTQHVFDWLMQNHHDSEGEGGIDQGDDDENSAPMITGGNHSIRTRGNDEDMLENVSDEQTSKSSPRPSINPIENVNRLSRESLVQKHSKSKEKQRIWEI